MSSWISLEAWPRQEKCVDSDSFVDMMDCAFHTAKLDCRIIIGHQSSMFQCTATLVLANYSGLVTLVFISGEICSPETVYHD